MEYEHYRDSAAHLNQRTTAAFKVWVSSGCALKICSIFQLFSAQILNFTCLLISGVCFSLLTTGYCCALCNSGSGSPSLSKSGNEERLESSINMDETERKCQHKKCCEGCFSCIIAFLVGGLLFSGYILLFFAWISLASSFLFCFIETSNPDAPFSLVVVKPNISVPKEISVYDSMDNGSKILENIDSEKIVYGQHVREHWILVSTGGWIYCHHNGMMIYDVYSIDEFKTKFQIEP